MKTRVLVVDDEPDVARYLSTILSTNGYEAAVAVDVEDGFAQALEMNPDLVCLDIMMPRESGISMYKRLREHDETSETPVIIISGAEQEGKFNFRTYLPDESIAEPDCYMEKPVDIDRFLETVKRLTAKKNVSERS